MNKQKQIAQQSSLPAHKDDSPDWRTNLMVSGSKHHLDAKSPNNAYLYFKHHPDVAGRLVYDEFSDRHLIAMPMPWDKPSEGKKFRQRRISDNDAFHAMIWLEVIGVKLSKQMVFDAMIAAATENNCNPVRAYLEKLEWDKKERLETWLSYYLGAADPQPTEYLALVGKKWLTAIVSRVYEPGCKFDHMLILEGRQGIGKSTALRELATLGGESFFYDGKVSFTDKDTLMALQGKIIVEMAELASFKKAVNEDIKSFITRQYDDYRPPYGRAITDRPRFFVPTGSTNEKEYLPPDESGHRRYWPVYCQAIDIPAITRDREQLWAEAVHWYKSGYSTYVEIDDISLFTKEQESRVMIDVWDGILGLHLDATMNDQTVDDMFKMLQIEPKFMDNFGKNRIKTIFRNHDWYETRDNGKRVWRKNVTRKL